MPDFWPDLRTVFLSLQKKCPVQRVTREEDDLERLFARRATRKLSKSLSFQYEWVLYQLEPTFPNRFRATHVNILKRIGKPILIESGGREHPYSIWEMAPYSKPKVLDSKQLEAYWPSPQKTKPAKHHHWRR